MYVKETEKNFEYNSCNIIETIIIIGKKTQNF
jgi:hypothetical protein